MSELFKNLNEAQRAAVTDYNSPSLIVAGAGAGKTRVLTSRIAYMLEQGVPPWRILALTFTNKAAGEMRDRIARMVSRELSDRLWMGTFHSIFLRILRVESDRLGYPPGFTVYDTADSRNVVKAIIKEMNLNDEHYKPNAVFARISLAKNNLVTPEAYEANAVYIAEDRQKRMPQFVDVYKAYVSRCKANAAMDFDDLLLNINILFRDFPDVLAKYQERFQYVLVDEYQDTNYAQYIIIRRLAERHSQVCVVGDDAQSIYSFRGARIENILRFRNDYPAARTYKLEQNYRSTQTIVNAANSVIEKNRNRLDKSSFSAGDTGEKITVIRAYTDQEEAAQVADEIRGLVRSYGAGWGQIAVLYRTNMQSRAFEEAFRRRGIPYKIYGGTSFYQRKEVKDMLAYLRLIANPRDDEAFRRIVNYPARGIGDVTVGRISAFAAANGMSCFEAAESQSLVEAGLNAGAEKKMHAFTGMIRKFSGEQAGMTLYETGLGIATASGIIGGYRAEQTPEAQSALDNIEELLNSMQVFTGLDDRVMRFDEETGEPLESEPAPPTLSDWLQSITLLTDMDNEKEGEKEKVTMMTIHAAKGLEYKFVFVVGLEENLFPSQMCMDSPEGIEEERRLFYVALTRAEERAFLSFSEMRFRWGSMEFCRPSRFLGEIDRQYLDAAFDLDDMEGRESPAAALRRNYDAHNAGETGDPVRGGGYGRRDYGRGDGGNYHGRPVFSKSGNTANRNTGGAAAAKPLAAVNPESRFRSIGSRAPGQQNADGSPSTPGAVPSDGVYEVGQRVTHAKFGAGTVSAIEKMAADLKITVAFDDPAAGRKTLLGKFAKLAVIK